MEKLFGDYVKDAAVRRAASEDDHKEAPKYDGNAGLSLKSSNCLFITLPSFRATKYWICEDVWSMQ